jgi:hypothetical protein
MKKMLEKGSLNRDRLIKRDVLHQRPSREELEKAKHDEDHATNHPETREENEAAFFANQYWEKPQLIEASLDDLLKSEGFEL